MNEQDNTVRIGCIIALAVLVLAAVITLLFWGIPTYNVWSSGLYGQAKLREAEYSKQVEVEAAKAKLEAAKYLNQAEIERAKGVAEANRIIGDSLNGKEEYLRYLWIQGLHDTHADVIYVPTEAGLPILEAGRGAKKPVAEEGKKK